MLLKRTLLSLLVLTGCTSPSTFQPYSKSEIKTVVQSRLLLGEEYKQVLDKDLLTLEFGNYHSYQEYRITLKNDLPYVYGEHPNLVAGTSTRLQKSPDGDPLACFNNTSYRNLPVEFCLQDTDQNGYFDYGVFKGVGAYNLNVPYKKESIEKITASRNYRKRELLFKGIANNKLDFTYNEYIANMEYPSNTENFKINFPRNAIVQFNYKGAKFEILATTNFEITYRVLSDFDPI